jgi:hypothetical protein
MTFRACSQSSRFTENPTQRIATLTFAGPASKTASIPEKQSKISCHDDSINVNIVVIADPVVGIYSPFLFYTNGHTALS